LLLRHFPGLQRAHVSKLPEQGEVFALEVSKGVDVLLRVVAALGKTRCVVMTKPADGAYEVQPIAHHGWNRPMLGGWVNEPAPPQLRSLGVVPLRPGESDQVLHPETWVKLPKKTAGLSHKVLPLCAWDLLVRDATLQWRWDHQREQVLAEDAKAEREKKNAFEAAIAAQGKRRATLQKKGVASLKRRRFFAAWKGAVPGALIREAEAAMRDAVLSLEGKSPAQAARRLATLVRTFNKLDGHHGRRFDTTDAEDIMDAVGTVAFASGVDDVVFDEVIDAVREF
jgi:hypothetical protein